MEKIKKIVAEMRKDIPRVVDTKVILNNYADRIEKAATNCNQLKMREALEWFWSKRSMLDFCHNNLSSKTWEDWDKVYHFLREFADKVQSALSAPSRNCDRFANELDAQIAFLNEVWLISVDKDTMLEWDKFENWTELMKSSYAKWLLAEVKGENNGND